MKISYLLTAPEPARGTEFHKTGDYTKYSPQNIVSRTPPSHHLTLVCSCCTANTCRNLLPATAIIHHTATYRDQLHFHISFTAQPRL